MYRGPIIIIIIIIPTYIHTYICIYIYIYTLYILCRMTEALFCAGAPKTRCGNATPSLIWSPRFAKAGGAHLFKHICAKSGLNLELGFVLLNCFKLAILRPMLVPMFWGSEKGRIWRKQATYEVTFKVMFEWFVGCIPLFRLRLWGAVSTSSLVEVGCHGLGKWASQDFVIFLRNSCASLADNCGDLHRL